VSASRKKIKPPPRPTMKQRLDEALRERDAASASLVELTQVLTNIRERARDMADYIHKAVEKVRKGK
jgi:hypothetical protein